MLGRNLIQLGNKNRGLHRDLDACHLRNPLDRLTYHRCQHNPSFLVIGDATNFFDLFRRQEVSSLYLELRHHLFGNLLPHHDGLFAGTYRAIVKRFGRQDILDRERDIGGDADVYRDIAGSNSYRRRAGAITCLDQLTCTGGQNQRQTAMAHQLLGGLGVGFGQPLDAVLGRARLERRLAADPGCFRHTVFG